MKKNRRFKKVWYVGMDKSYTYRAFQLAYRPTERKQGGRYLYVVGPFRTMRAALWTERFGTLNPHFGSVEDAERLSRAWEIERPIPQPPKQGSAFVRG